VDLEHRVKVLEQELEILKNQIQATLLDVQEQVLSSYHPALRADHASEMARPGGARESQEIDQETYLAGIEDTQVLTRSGVKTVSAREAQDEQAAPALAEEEEPVVRRVSLKDLQDEAEEEEPDYAAPAPAPALVPNEAVLEGLEDVFDEPEPLAEEDYIYEEEPEYQPPAPAPVRAPQASLMDRLSTSTPEPLAESDVDWGTFTTLAEWVSENLEKMGSSRMRRMVDAVSKQVSISPELKDALLEMITLYEEDSALEEVRLYETARAMSRGLSDAPAPAYAPATEHGRYEDEPWYDEMDGDEEPAWKRNLIQRLISGLESLDQGQEDDRG
jgi:hypothetical protein